MLGAPFYYIISAYQPLLNLVISRGNVFIVRIQMKRGQERTTESHETHRSDNGSSGV